MHYVVGAIATHIAGNFTTLNTIKPADKSWTERNLGFHRGRLGPGYYIFLLKEVLKPEHFQFDGNTLRSGGRLGLPAGNESLDRLRLRVHDDMMKKYGPEEYRSLQKWLVKTGSIAGPKRFVKVVPVIDHNPHMAPNVQYPMGGGQGQWKLLKGTRLKFLCAAKIGLGAQVRFPYGELNLSTGNDDADRASRSRLALFLQSA